MVLVYSTQRKTGAPNLLQVQIQNVHGYFLNNLASAVSVKAVVQTIQLMY